MVNKRTIVNSSTRTVETTTTVEYANSVPNTNLTQGQYLDGILSGNPGQGTMIEPAYSAVVPGTIGSRAQGMFLN